MDSIITSRIRQSQVALAIAMACFVLINPSQCRFTFTYSKRTVFTNQFVTTFKCTKTESSFELVVSGFNLQLLLLLSLYETKDATFKGKFLTFFNAKMLFPIFVGFNPSCNFILYPRLEFLIVFQYFCAELLPEL